MRKLSEAFTIWSTNIIKALFYFRFHRQVPVVTLRVVGRRDHDTASRSEARDGKGNVRSRSDAVEQVDPEPLGKEHLRRRLREQAGLGAVVVTDDNAARFGIVHVGVDRTAEPLRGLANNNLGKSSKY
jgi:hypothetical protein